MRRGSTHLEFLLQNLRRLLDLVDTPLLLGELLLVVLFTILSNKTLRDGLFDFGLQFGRVRCITLAVEEGRTHAKRSTLLFEGPDLLPEIVQLDEQGLLRVVHLRLLPHQLRELLQDRGLLRFSVLMHPPISTGNTNSKGTQPTNFAASRPAIPAGRSSFASVCSVCSVNFAAWRSAPACVSSRCRKKHEQAQEARTNG